MARRHLFSDESGRFVPGPPDTSRYFAIGTVHLSAHALAGLRHAMAELREWLACTVAGYDTTFHASDDNQLVRMYVFELLAGIDFRFDATLLDITVEEPFRRTAPQVYAHVWRAHLAGLAPELLEPGDELLVTAATIGTGHQRRAFRAGVEAALVALPEGTSGRVVFWPAATDYAVQAADYCLWAVLRLQDRDDDQHFSMIKDKIHSVRVMDERLRDTGLSTGHKSTL